MYIYIKYNVKDIKIDLIGLKTKTIFFLLKDFTGQYSFSK